jgi:hypothetical protein
MPWGLRHPLYAQAGRMRAGTPFQRIAISERPLMRTPVWLKKASVAEAG